MKIGVIKESKALEARVALTPEAVVALNKKNVQVVVEQGAGVSAGFSDDDYQKSGAAIVADSSSVLTSSDIVVKVRGPEGAEYQDLRATHTFVSFLDPLAQDSQIKRLSQTGVCAFAMEFIPRISRAQSMDALSSQANIAGYKAVLLAANQIQQMMPMLMTAAGTISPAKVLVIGAGVAGLQAIATAKRLGAVVYGFDVRSDVKEQVESLGGKFVQLKLEDSGEGEGGYAREMSAEAMDALRLQLGRVVADMDIVITTAQIPGRSAPLLVTADAVQSMRNGSVIVDLAASSGGNVAGSVCDETVEQSGIMILGPSNLPSLLPQDASRMYSNNILSFLDQMISEGSISIDWEDEVIRQAVVCKDGKIVHERLKHLEKVNS